MTHNQPAMSPPASHLPANPQAATAATTAAVAAVAVQQAAVVAADARVALVLGATGLVGREILALIQAGKTWRAVHTVGRRAPGQSHPKLVAHVTDSLSGFIPPAVNDVFIALGTTIKAAGSQQAFRAVDFDAVVALAQSARTAGATRIGIVSAMGADARSTVFYNRVKGEMEEAVRHLGYEVVIIARPSLLTGDRGNLAQPTRPAEKAAQVAMTLFKPLIPVNYRAIAAADVAQALVGALEAEITGHHVLLSGHMQPH